MARPKKQLDEPKEVISETTKKPIKIRAKLAVPAAGRFDIFSSQEQVEQTRSLLASVKLADGFKSAGEVARDYLPVPHMALQYIIGRIGIPARTIVEFIGQEGIGKSSLLFHMMGCFVKRNIPCLYLNCEPKMLEPDWAMRLVDPNKAIASKVLQFIEVQENCKTLNQMDKMIRQWVKIKREGDKNQGIPPLPLDIPLCVVVDPYTKLLDPKEEELAMGNEVDKNGAVKGIQDLGKQPATFAKWMHEFSTNIAKAFLEPNNVTLFLVSGQNQKLNDMTAGFLADGGASRNKTRKGGNAVNQSAALQITVTRKGLHKVSGNNVGKKVLLHVVKNSYGPDEREILYVLRNEGFVDSETESQQAIDMDEALCTAIAECKDLDITCSLKRYSSDSMGFHGISAAKLVDMINNDEELQVKIGRALQISGYEADLTE